MLYTFTSSPHILGYCYYMVFKYCITNNRGFPGGSVVKNLPAKARDLGLIPGFGRSPGEGNDNSLQYPRLGNPMDRGIWWATSPWGPKELDMI